MKPCNACPFNDNEESIIAQNYGCLPTHKDMIDLFDTTNISLSCHDNDGIACRGLSLVRDTSQTKIKPYSEWYENS